MKMHYITKIRSNLSINATKKTRSLLEGMYCSIYKGRSMDFDDLREYIPGDNVKDIDWKSSIRHGSLLTRRFIALRKHSILFLYDSGIKMQGDSKAGDKKSEIQILSSGTLGYLINKNGDEIGALYYDSGLVNSFRFKAGLDNLEQILTTIEKRNEEETSLNVNDLLEYVIKNIKRRTIIVLVTDIDGMDKINEELIKKITIMHDLLIINISDASLFGDDTFDIDKKAYLPSIISKSKKLPFIEATTKKQIMERQNKMLNKYAISSVEIDSIKDIIPKLINLLERHNHASISNSK